LKRALPDLRRLTILVVEDHPDTADLVTTTLTACGATVHVAHRAEQARTLLGEVRPQAVVCDLSPREGSLGRLNGDGGSPLRFLRPGCLHARRMTACVIGGFT